MTSKLTREENVQAVFDLKAGYTLGLADVEILKRVARMALAAMDSEPVAWMVIDIDTGERIIRCDRSYIEGSCQPLYRHAQPAPVVPDRMTAIVKDEAEYVEGWNACRAAMLQAGNSPVIPGAEQRISDAVDLLKKAAPAMLADNGGPDGPLAGRLKSPVTPEGWQVEAERLAEMHGMSFVLFRHGEAPQCADPTKVVISFTDKGLGHDTLPAAPQEVKGE